MTETYKTLQNLNQSHVLAFYEQKEVYYNLRIKKCKLRSTRTKNFGVESIF